ncbi:MAG TPA: type II secretion system protein [bacterium]|nr:type II secretion system protein [bacterium]
MKNKKGFTLIELMIVVAIIGILSAVAIPRFADMLEKAREGATKGNIGAIKSSISIYYGDQMGIWPDDLTTPHYANYMPVIPQVKVTCPHGNKLSGSSNVILMTQKSVDIGVASTDDGWRYFIDANNRGTGEFYVNNGQPDTRGLLYSRYGYE